MQPDAEDGRTWNENGNSDPIGDAQLPSNPVAAQPFDPIAGTGVPKIDKQHLQGSDPEANRKVYLDSILNKAVDPDILTSIMADMGFEKTIVNTSAAPVSQYCCFRTGAINDIIYILCPVPFLYDEKRNIEAGFAIDVDQDHFVVYAFMHNYTTNESLILSKLPHCVHKAITLDASDYSSIGDEIKDIANETSAIFFINNLVADVTLENMSPLEFFDDKLYLQLLNRFVTVTEPRWINITVIHKKFGQIMNMFKTLDVNDEFYENNKLRMFMNLAQFMNGVSDLISSNCFARYLNVDAIKQHENVIHAYLESEDFLNFYFGFDRNYEREMRSLLDLFMRCNSRVSGHLAESILDAYHEKIKDTKMIETLEEITALGSHPDYIGLYQRATSMAEITLGANHLTTKKLKAHLVACTLKLERQSNANNDEFMPGFLSALEVISRAGAETIAFNAIDVTCLPENELGIVMEGISYLAQHQESIIEIANTSTWFRLGRVFDNLSFISDADICYRAAIIHNPKHSLSWYNLGQHHLDEPSPEEAKRCVIHAYDLNPYNPHALCGLGTIKENEKNFREAERYYRMALAMRPDIEAKPALVETRILPKFWESVERSLKRVVDKT